MEQLDASQDSAVAPAAEEVTEVVESTSPDDPVETETLLPEVESDDEEIDYEGEKYKVPKVLKDAFLRQQDYTVKTQTVAEQRREVEAQQAQLAQQHQLQQQYLAEYAEAFALDNQLKQFSGINWSELIEQDPVQAMRLQHQMNTLKARREEVVSTVTQKQQQAMIQMQRETAKRVEEAASVLSREIQGWSAGNEVDQKITSYAMKQYNIPKLGDLIGYVPSIGVILHKAMQYDELKKQVATKSPPTPQEKPITRITATKGTAAKDPSKMTDHEFAQWRKRQIAQRA